MVVVKVLTPSQWSSAECYLILLVGKFVLCNDASRAHRLLDIKHMVIVTYFFRGNLLCHIGYSFR